MAVQAQYQDNGVNLQENHSHRTRPPQFHQVVGNDVVDHRTSSFLNANSFLGKSPAFQIPSTVNMAGSNQYRLINQLAGGRHAYTQQLDSAALLNGGDKDRVPQQAGNLMPGSNSGRKRVREQVEDLQICSPWQQQQQQQQQPLLINLTQPEANQTTGPGSVVNPQSNGVSTGLQLRLTLEDDRLRSNSPVSTSGRVEPAGAKSSFVSAMAENLGSNLRQERDEIAQLLKIQNEQLKSFLDEKRQRHTHQLVAAVEETFTRKLREKDTELEKAKLQNHELMERFSQLNAESHHWQAKVRNTEAMVNILRANLQQAQQQAAQQQSQFPHSHRMDQFPCKEGCGDSEGAGADDCASSYVDDINDAHTRAFNENKELREQRTCRVCRCADVSMLLLPCRHLCLCQDCEGQLFACPICRMPKNASVQVYMS